MTRVFGSRARLPAMALLGALLLAAAQGVPGQATAMERVPGQAVIIGVQLEPPILDPTASPAAAITE